MSQTLHCHQEILFCGVWEHYRHCGIIKDCEAMGLAGSHRYRDRWPAIQPQALGIPRDVTPGTAINLNTWRHDSHSHTFFTSHEVVKMYAWWDATIKKRNKKASISSVWESNFATLYRMGWDNWFNYPDSWAELRRFGLQDYRWIFWLDG